MSRLAQTLAIATSPHIQAGHRVEVIMRNVVYALLPVCVFAVYAFGWTALLTLVTAIGSCMLTEHVFSRTNGKPSTLGDGSVLITGMLYGLTLPPHLPLWMTALGGLMGVGMGKCLFGGLGYNPFNPALVGRAFLQAAFPSAMTAWIPGMLNTRWQQIPTSTLTWPFTAPNYEGITSATPLAMAKFESHFAGARELALGFTSGSTGETCGVLILLGGLYLAIRHMMNWRIPIAIFVTVAGLSLLFQAIDPTHYAGPMFMLFSGGLMLGAVFMATDMVASPITHTGSVIYGILIGILVVVIRYWGGMPEGVMYAILLANAVSPHIDQWIQPRVYGTTRKAVRHAS
ncbi:MAG: electron transport complex protein RnfD [Candidatus Omnitrophota bacterium]|jgi:Na+-translocating ferredoxin:NAD+ oxidoreductase subunit D